jgi:hypothetical protein
MGPSHNGLPQRADSFSSFTKRDQDGEERQGLQTRALHNPKALEIPDA